jgi:hypothetical protein
VSHDGRGLRVGGQLLQVRRWSEYRIEVRRVMDANQADGEWRYAGRPRLRGSGQPQAVRRYLGLEEDEWPIVRDGDAEWVFHFGGARRRAVLELAALRGPRSGERELITDWFIRRPRDTPRPAWLAASSATMLELTIVDRLESLERTLGRPRANAALPLDIRVDECRGWLALEEEVAAIVASRWATVRDAELLHSLLGIAKSLRRPRE